MKFNKDGSVYSDCGKDNLCGYIDKKIWINGELRDIRRDIFMFSPLEQRTFSANELREIIAELDKRNNENKDESED